MIQLTERLGLFYRYGIARISEALYEPFSPVLSLFPFREVVVAYSLVRKILGLYTLGNAAPNQIEDSVEHSPFPVAGRSTELGGLQYQ